MDAKELMEKAKKLYADLWGYDPDEEMDISAIDFNHLLRLAELIAKTEAAGNAGQVFEFARDLLEDKFNPPEMPPMGPTSPAIMPGEPYNPVAGLFDGLESQPRQMLFIKSKAHGWNVCCVNPVWGLRPGGVWDLRDKLKESDDVEEAWAYEAVHD